MGWESSDVFTFDIGEPASSQTMVAKLKKAKNLFIIVPTVL